MKPTDATEERIPLNLLIEWENNPRKSRDTNDDARMAVNLEKVGQQAPLIVVKGDDEALYKVVEGETRRRGFNINANDGKIDPDALIRCWILPSDTTHEQLMAIAVSANTIRNEMNPIEEMEAYQNLALAGMKPRAIAPSDFKDSFSMQSRRNP